MIFTAGHPQQSAKSPDRKKMSMFTMMINLKKAAAKNAAAFSITKQQSYSAARPVAPAGTPLTVCTLLKLPLLST